MVEKNSKEMAKIAVAALEEKKAKYIKILDISCVYVLAEFYHCLRKQPQPGTGYG